MIYQYDIILERIIMENCPAGEPRVGCVDLDSCRLCWNVALQEEVYKHIFQTIQLFCDRREYKRVRLSHENSKR